MEQNKTKKVIMMMMMKERKKKTFSCVLWGVFLEQFSNGGAEGATSCRLISFLLSEGVKEQRGAFMREEFLQD